MTLAGVLGWSAALAQVGAQSCGNPFVNHYGPWDFRTTTPASRAIVERVHFTPGVESLTRQATSTYREMARDVAYTLGVYPNHHRALITMRRLSERWRTDPAPGSDLTVECWFDRAIRFRPDDTVARALYAQFLHSRKRTDDAVAQLEIAVGHAKDNPLSRYNLGLVFLEIGQPSLALREAHAALEGGFTRTDLRDALQRIGQWREPEAAAGAASAPAPTASSP